MAELVTPISQVSAYTACRWLKSFSPQVLGSCEGLVVISMNALMNNQQKASYLGWFAKLADMYRNALLRSAHTTSDGGKSHRYCIRWLRMRGHRSHGSASH